MNREEEVTLLISVLEGSDTIHDWYILGEGSRRKFNPNMTWKKIVLPRKNVLKYVNLYGSYLRKKDRKIETIVRVREEMNTLCS